MKNLIFLCAIFAMFAISCDVKKPETEVKEEVASNDTLPIPAVKVDSNAKVLKSDSLKK